VVGGSTGTVNDSLYQGGKYTPGTKYASFTISNIVYTFALFKYENKKCRFHAGFQFVGTQHAVSYTHQFKV